MKKKLLILLIGTALLLTAAACSKTDPDSESAVSVPPAETSAAESSLPNTSASASSAAKETAKPETTPAPDSSAPASSAAETVSDDPVAGETHSDLLPDFTTNSADFKTQFLQNNIDETFIQDISQTASVSAMVTVVNATTTKWEDAVDSAYRIALDSCSTDEATAKVKDVQVKWAGALEDTLNDIRNKGDDSFDTAIQILQVYRGQAAVLLEMAYENNGSYAFPAG